MKFVVELLCKLLGEGQHVHLLRLLLLLLLLHFSPIQADNISISLKHCAKGCAAARERAAAASGGSELQQRGWLELAAPKA